MGVFRWDAILTHFIKKKQRGDDVMRTKLFPVHHKFPLSTMHASTESSFTDLYFGINSDFSDDMFDIDFSDLSSHFYDFSSSTDGMEDSSEYSSVEVVTTSSRKDQPVKSRGSKFMKKTVHPKEDKPRKKIHKRVNGALPNMSRRPPSTILYAFPNFDKCDSLLYLTSSLTRHLNTGDFPALYKLLTTHLEKDCQIAMHGVVDGLSIRALTKMFRLMDDIQPDRIVCVYDTKVVGNQILSSAHMKFTDSKAIYDSVARTVRDPMLREMFTEKREDHLRRKILLNDRPEEEKEHLRALVESQQDVLVHKRIDFMITFDHVTKKVTNFILNGTMTSIEAIESAIIQ